MLHVLWFFTAVYNKNLRIEHIPGKVNHTADDLSRGNMQSFFGRLCCASSNSRTAANATLSNQPRVHTASLQAAVQFYYHHGLTPANHKTYQAGQNRYFLFCAMASRVVLPTSEETLMLFASYLAQQGLAHATIKVYLSAICNPHLSSGLHQKYTQQLTPR